MAREQFAEVQGPVKFITTSHSVDNLFDYCARKFEFATMYDKRPDRDSGFAADVGTALHEGLQRYVLLRNAGENEQHCVEQAYLTLLQWYPFADERDQHTGVRSFDNTNLMLYKLMRWEGWDDWELVQVDGFGWGIEIPFRIRHESIGSFVSKNTGETCMLATQGKIDFVLRHKKTGVIATLDLKTTIVSEDLVEAEYKHSGQQVGYSQVIQHLLGEVLNEFDVYYLVAHFRSDDEPKIHLVKIEKDSDAIDDYWLGKIERLMRMRYYAEAGWFPRTNGGCHSWNKQCSFFKICQKRDYSVIQRWFDTELTDPIRLYDYVIDLAL